MDTVLQRIAQLQGPDWGDVLDAGTGRSSLAWLVSLPTRSWTAVTAEDGRAEVLARDFPPRPQDRLVVGNWSDERLLREQRYDVVVADYLFGSLERYAPHRQEQVLDRLLDLCRGQLYIVGLEPWPEPDSPSGELLWEIARLRDACWILQGRRPHRELPLEWMLERLNERVEHDDCIGWERFRNFYDGDFAERELRGVRQVLRRAPASRLREALHEHTQQLLLRAQSLKPVELSWDYLIRVDLTRHEPPC